MRRASGKQFAVGRAYFWQVIATANGHNVQETSSGALEVSNNISGVSQASQQTSAGSTQVLGAASELAKNGEKLKHEVSNSTIRAA